MLSYYVQQFLLNLSLRMIPVIVTTETCFCSDNSEASVSWPRHATLELIRLVGENENRFQNSMRKQVSIIARYDAGL